MSPSHTRRVANVYTLWTFSRAIFHRGWWLVTSLYFVVEANLTPFELVFIGTAQALTAIAFEVPAGVLADVYSRKWSLVVGQLIMGASMFATGLFTTFPELVLTQMLWGLSWTFLSGADAAWLTDELRDAALTNQTLAGASAWEQVGGVVGILGLGAVAWLTEFALTIQLAGVAMTLMGLFVALRFPEGPRPRGAGPRSAGVVAILKEGLTLARADRSLLTILLAILLICGAEAAFTRLFQKGLVDLGMPELSEPIIWFTAIGVASLVLSALVLRLATNFVVDARWVRVTFVGGCTLAAFGLVAFGVTQTPVVAMVSVVLVNGVAWALLRTLAVIWANERASSRARATVLSLLSQVEHFGKILLGTGLGLVAQTASMSIAMAGAGGLMLCAGLLVLTFHLHEA